MIGGNYYAISGKHGTDKPVKPAISCKLTPQQVGPILCKASVQVNIGSTRSGKSRVGFFSALIQLMEPGSSVGYIVPSPIKAKAEIITKLITEYIPSSLIKSFNKSNYHTELVNGSTLDIFTSGGGEAGSASESVLGREFNLMIIEEAREHTHLQETYELARGRTININGRILLVSSTRSNHYLEDIVQHQVLGTHVKCFELKLEDNHLGIPDPEGPQKIMALLKEEWGTNRYLADILGQWVPLDGLDFNDFDKDIHIVDKVPGTIITPGIWQTNFWLKNNLEFKQGNVIANPNHRFDFIIGMDVGSTFAAVVFKASVPKHIKSLKDINISNLHLTAVADFREFNMSIFAFIGLLKKKMEPSRCCIIIDPTAKTPNSRDCQSDVAVLQKAGFTVWPPSKYPDREISTDICNQRLKLGLLHIKPGCKRTIESISKLKSAGKSRSQQSTDIHGHLSDCIRYVNAMMFNYIDLFRPENEGYFNNLLDKYKGSGAIDKKK